MPAPATDPPPIAFGVLIPNWNGEAFIERCLGSVLAAARHAGRPMELVVVDDASADQSPRLIAERFPQVRLIRLARNVGFGRAVARGMAELSADWVFLLNNDVALRADFFSRMIETLHAGLAEGKRLLAIGGRTLDWETGAINHGGQRRGRERGLIVQQPFEADEAAPADFFQAGACLVHRPAFLALGGFADLYHPGYWEDYDLALHGAARGLTCLYEPRAIAWHCGKGSMRRRLGESGLALVLRRNHLLFNWVNLPLPDLLRHLARLGPLCLAGLPRERGSAAPCPWGRAVLAALVRLGPVLRLRRRRARG